MEQQRTTPRTFRTPLGDVVTTYRGLDETCQIEVENVEIEVPLSLVRDRRPLDDNPGRNWEKH